MLNPISAIQSYRPPFWMAFDEPDDLPEFVEGDLVEFDDYYGEYVGCGIIKRITISEFKNPKTGTFEKLPCAIIVPATGDTWLDYVPLTHIDPLSLDNYVEIYLNEYGTESTDVLTLRRTVATRMSAYSRVCGHGSVPSMQEAKVTVSLQANTNGGAQ